MGAWRFREFKVLAQPLHAPSSPAIELEKTSNNPNQWLFAPSAGQFWLLTGWIGKALYTRPRLVRLSDVQLSSPPQALADDQLTLGSAMRVADFSERRDALKQVFEILANDLEHPDWEDVSGFLRSLISLPPPTYDVICALASTKNGAVTAVLKQPRETFQAVWNSLDKLGVSWHTIPFGLWLHAARQAGALAFANEHAALVGGSPALLRQILCGLFEQSENGPGFFPVLLAALHTYDNNFPAPAQDYFSIARTSAGRSALSVQIGAFAAELRTRALATGATFPSIRLSSHETVPDAQNLLAHFGLADHPRFMWECLLAPIWAAHTMATGSYVKSEELDDLRLLKSFDEDWFNAAHAAALTVFLGEKLENDNSYFEEAERQVLKPQLRAS